ncbi:MAG TPA: class I SAM-dependent methyltransferase [Anaerolineales bacterium]|nr:class I SAM-dependent methyltransferase [Anaerolineales bacterium]
MPAVILKAGREKSLLRRHPWVFSGAIQHVDENIAPGETVDLLSFDGQFLARAAYSPSSQIRARVWTFDDEPVDADFFRKRIRAAIQSRDVWGLRRETDSYRLIYAESDDLPGLIVDRYGDVLVLQSLTTGSEFWKETFADILLEETGLSTLFERSDADVRGLEGLEPQVGLLRDNIPQLSRNIPRGPITIHEHNLLFNVNFAGGHKTGFYLDQRRNRLRVRALAKDLDVLDCFCYTGGFTVNALSGGAKSVLSVDSSADALALCQENIALNQLSPDRHSVLEGDVFHLLRKFRDEGRSFDMIILDPPKFAPTAAQAEKAARGYKDINLFALKLLRPSGRLVTFSCSGGIDAGLFQKIIAGAALDAGVEAQIVEHLSQAVDHPVALNFPEAAYLKGFICLRR